MSDKKIMKEWKFRADFSVSLGETYTRFMEGLKERKFIGNRCGNHTFFPPLPFCGKSFETPSGWFENDGVGQVEAFTVCTENSCQVNFPCTDLKPQAPYILAAIRIDKSDQCLIHYLGGLDPAQPGEILEAMRVGLRVKPVWREERSGTIMDIQHFIPLD